MPHFRLLDGLFMWGRRIVREIQEIVYKSPIGWHFLDFYKYCYDPAQLCGLCGFISESACVPGAIIEVGCAAGHTTVFLNKYMDACGIEKEYICVDTFSGFTKDDVEYEAEFRNKGMHLARYAFQFHDNDKRRFDRRLQYNGVTRVQSIKADANEFDFLGVGRIAFCLIDVDLYRPIKKVLEQVFPLMASGGDYCCR